jgi:DNA-binding response OmpR family regulator
LGATAEGPVGYFRLVVERDAQMGVNSEPPMGGEAGRTILVVEDDPSLRMLCRVNLELDRYQVLEAESLGRAEELVRGEAIDLVLLDIHVGERDGRELLPLLHEHQPNAAICLLSGTSEADPPQVGAGVKAFIRKPFELEELSGTIQRLLHEEPARP